MAALVLHNLTHLVEVDSAGTAAWHTGKAPDERSQAHAKTRGMDLSGLRARQVSAADFNHFDYILAMDQQNLQDLLAQRPAASKAEIALFLDYSAGADVREVPDPYYGGEQGFERVLDLVSNAAEGFVQHLKKHDLRPHNL
jgi:protein-tyrosine phosphatase